MNHQLNRSLVKYIRAESKIFKQTFDMNLIPAKRYEDKVRSIMAKRAFDRNPMPSKRAFRGMVGLAVLYPSVVDCIERMIGTLSASCVGL